MINLMVLSPLSQCLHRRKQRQVKMLSGVECIPDFLSFIHIRSSNVLRLGFTSIVPLSHGLYGNITPYTRTCK